MEAAIAMAGHRTATTTTLRPDLILDLLERGQWRCN
jgi:hypothetical protein